MDDPPKNKKDLSSLNSRWKDVIATGHLNLTNALPEEGADVNYKNQANETPLMMAIRKNNILIITCLRAHNAYINCENHRGIKPLKLAIANKNEMLVKYPVKEGANVNQKSRDKERPLNHALYYRNKEIIKFLITQGVDINYEDKGTLQTNALVQKAIYEGHRTALLFLLERGCKPKTSR